MKAYAVLATTMPAKEKVSLIHRFQRPLERWTHPSVVGRHAEDIEDIVIGLRK